MREKIDFLLSESKKVILLTHKRPDGDAISSLLLVKAYIENKFPKVNVEGYIERNGDNCRLDGCVNLKNIKSLKEISNCTLILLDGNRIDRSTDLRPKNTKTVMIDHHEGEPEKFDFVISDLNRTSTTEIVGDEFYENFFPTKETAELYLYGVLSDTGGLKWVTSKNAKVLSKIEKVLGQYFFDLNEVQRDLEEYTPEENDILKELIKNSKVNKEKGVMTTYLTRGFAGDYDEDSVVRANHVHLHNFSRKVKGLDMAVNVIPLSNGDTYASFRSKEGGRDMRLMAEHFGGGGHRFAAGAEFKDQDPEEVLDMIIEYLD